jgi:hypothetical protein
MAEVGREPVGALVALQNTHSPGMYSSSYSKHNTTGHIASMSTDARRPFNFDFGFELCAQWHGRRKILRSFVSAHKQTPAK